MINKIYSVVSSFRDTINYLKIFLPNCRTCSKKMCHDRYKSKIYYFADMLLPRHVLTMPSHVSSKTHMGCFNSIFD